MYTFVITCYNQEKYIVQLLESIRYQVEEYGGGKSVELVIGDDHSTDRTTEIIDRWLGIYGHLFSNIIRNYSEENSGTCKNITSCYRMMTGDRFREISGDDILPKGNIFDAMDMTERYDVIACPVLFFDDKGIRTDRDAYRYYLRQSLVGSLSGRCISKYGCVVFNGALWKKFLLNEAIYDYMCRYLITEDRPMWYRIYKDNKRVDLTYYGYPTLMQRIHSESITNKDSASRGIHEKDIESIYRDIKAEDDSLLTDYLIWSNNHLKKRLSVMRWYFEIKELLNRSKLNDMWEKLSGSMAVNTRHLEMITRRADAFMISNGYKDV